MSRSKSYLVDEIEVLLLLKNQSMRSITKILTLQLSMLPHFQNFKDNKNFCWGKNFQQQQSFHISNFQGGGFYGGQNFFMEVFMVEVGEEEDVINPDGDHNVTVKYVESMYGMVFNHNFD